MTIGSTSGRVLIAVIPVAAMLFIEVGLPFLRKRRKKENGYPEAEGVPQNRSAAAAAPRTSAEDVPRSRPNSRWSQNGRYFQVLYQTAQAGSLSAMNKLGEFAFVRRNFVEAFYWKLMLEMRHGKPSGLPARAVCHVWQDAGCPASDSEECGSFTDSQSRLAMAVLDLWSGRHVHTPTETIRTMMEEGDRDALLYAKRFGIGHTGS